MKSPGSRVKYFLGTLDRMLHERPPLDRRASEEVRTTSAVPMPISIVDRWWELLAGASGETRNRDGFRRRWCGFPEELRSFLNRDLRWRLVGAS